MNVRLLRIPRCKTTVADRNPTKYELAYFKTYSLKNIGYLQVSTGSIGYLQVSTGSTGYLQVSTGNIGYPLLTCCTISYRMHRLHLKYSFKREFCRNCGIHKPADRTLPLPTVFPMDYSLTTSSQLE